MSLLVNVLAVIVAGTMVGVEIAVALMTPLFDRLPVDAGLRARAVSARRLGRIMPWWYVASIVLAGAVVATRWGSGAAPALLAMALFVASIVLSVAVLVPINTRAQGWSAENVPADWRTQLRRWDAVHLLRVGVILAGVVLLAVAVVR